MVEQVYADDRDETTNRDGTDDRNETTNRDGADDRDEIFEMEQLHLKAIYAQLLALRDELTEEIETSHHGARQDLIDLSEEIRVDLIGADETMETLAAIETLNSVIDAYNNYHDISVDKLARVLLLLEQPYFAKVTLKMRPHRPPRDVYIGTTGVTDRDANPLVVDWRSPIAETYYNQEFGRTSYRVNDHVRTVELTCRRQFDIIRDELRSYFDTSIAIEDALLLEALRRSHSEKLQAITATIQREQNAVIRHADVPVLLVSGIAGSGKTSIMLQRIAYVLYRQRENLDVRHVWLLTPSAVFGRYIDTVLPQLGEANPHIGTWEDFLHGLGLGERGDGRDGDISHLETLEQGLATLTLESRDFRAITLDGEQLLKPSQAESAWKAFAQFPAGARHTALASDKLHEALERKFGRMAREERWQEAMIELDLDEQNEIFGHMIEPTDEEETIALTREYVAHRFASAHSHIDELAWLRLDRIGCRMLSTDGLSGAELLWLRLLISGHGARDARYVVIDEVQDYTRLQLMVIARYFHGAHFLLLGDPHQAIRHNTANWDEIRTVFSTAALEEVRLMTSYRSSPEITALFASLLPEEERSELSSVQQAGKMPHIRACTDDEYLSTLRDALSRASTDTDRLTAVIAADRSRVHWLSRQLLSHQLGYEIVTLGDRDALPARGIVLLDLSLAKGLEFDRVIIPDAQAEVYPDTPLSRRRLYTAISRATHEVEIYAQGNLTPLLDE